MLIADTIIRRIERARRAKEKGQRICVESMQEMRALNCIAGVHVMAPRNESALAPRLAEFRDLK